MSNPPIVSHWLPLPLSRLKYLKDAKQRHLNHLKSYICQKVRELARVLYEATQRYPDHIRETTDLLHPKKILVESALTVSKFNAEENHQLQVS